MKMSAEVKESIPELRLEDWMSANAFPRAFEAGLSVVDASITEVLKCSFAQGREWMAAMMAYEGAVLAVWEEVGLSVVDAGTKPPEALAPKSVTRVCSGAAAA